MRKEVFWAGAIGITFGLVIAFGAWRINSNIKPDESSETQTPRPEPTSEFKITLDKPEQDDVVTESIVAASGITKPLSWITVSGEDGDYIIQSDQNGSFTQDVDLIPGVNQIKITAFDPAGNQSIEKVIVVYSSSFQTRTVVSAPTSGSASDDASIRQKVQEKVEAALYKPKAYLGTVTDIADTTIQIKTDKGEIKQISDADEGITVIKSGIINKTVKLADIAIGDFIVAMGYVNSNSVLAAQRILITSPLTEQKIEATFGEVSSTTKAMTVTSKKDSNQTTLSPDRNTDVFDYNSGKTGKVRLSDINEGDTVVYVTNRNSDTPSIRSIFVVQKKQSQ